MTSPCPNDLASALERTTVRLIVDFLATYQDAGPGPVQAVSFDDFAAALTGVSFLVRCGGNGLDPATQRALALAQRSILWLVARWPATLATEAAAWELAIAQAEGDDGKARRA